MDGKYGMMKSRLLADIGNSYFHIYDGKSVVHLSYEDAIDVYKDETLEYISVKSQLDSRIEEMKTWKNISSLMTIEGEYNTMGVDRKALCLSHSDGVFIDAGSAITVDVVEDNTYVGGFILPGLQAYLESYKNISPTLDTELSNNIDLTRLPITTKDGISYGIIASIKSLIEKHSKDNTLYFTGGDGMFLSTFFIDVHYDETLVFQGIQKALQMKAIKDR